MKQPPSKVAHNRPPTFFMYQPGCPNGPEKEIPYRQKLPNAGLGIQTGETLKTIRFFTKIIQQAPREKLNPPNFVSPKIKRSSKWILNIQHLIHRYIYNKKLDHIQLIQCESSLAKVKDNKTEMSSCPQGCHQMGSKHAKFFDYLGQSLKLFKNME